MVFFEVLMCTNICEISVSVYIESDLILNVSRPPLTHLVGSCACVSVGSLC